MSSRRRTSARVAAAPARRGVPSLAQLAPSGRSLLVGLAIVVVAVGGYLAARETSLFSVQRIDVTGGSPAVQAQVRTALRDEVGKSLLAVDGTALTQRLGSIAAVHSFRYDRAFPHTLRIVLRLERPVLVVRQGSSAFLISATGRVLRTLAHPRLSSLPRLWVTKDVQIVVGRTLPAEQAAAAAALAPLRGASLPGGVKAVQAGEHTLTLTLGGGLELRLGDAGDLRLKLAIARRILGVTGAATAGGGYLDVSVPERPVLSSNSQVGG